MVVRSSYLLIALQVRSVSVCTKFSFQAGFSALHVAARANDIDILKLILKQKKLEVRADLVFLCPFRNSKSNLKMNLIDPNGYSPLMVAAEEGTRSEIAKATRSNRCIFFHI